MPYDYEHTEELILDTTERGAFNTFVQAVWTGNPNDVTSATVRRQVGNATVVEVTGTKTFGNENLLPDPPFEVVERTGNSYRVQFTERGALNSGGLNNLNSFIGQVWPGATEDVVQLDFVTVQDESHQWRMRATLRGTLTAATGDELPSGKRFRIRNKT